MPPTDRDLDTLKWLLKRLNASEEYCRPYFERAKRYYRLWRFGSAINDEDWPYVNRVRSRDIFAFVEDSTALMVQTLLAQIPFFSVVPRETRMLMMQYENIDPLTIGRQIEKCLDYQISHEETEFFAEVVDTLKGGGMLGNGYTGVYPKFDRNGVYLRPLLKTHDYWDVLPIVGARRLSRAKGVFIRDFMTLDDLKGSNVKGQAIYKNLDQLAGRGSADSDPDKAWHRNLLQEVGMENYQADSDNIEVFNYISGGDVITFANRKVIIRDSRETAQVGQMMGIPREQLSPYPYDQPVVQYKYIPVPLEFFAMGIPEVLEVLQEDKNLIRSARRDNIDLVINTILKYREGSGINLDLIKFYPGALWPMENLQDVEEQEIRDVTQNAYQEEAMRTSDMENALSLFGYARGMTPQHSEQPTTVLKLQQASLNRIDLAVKLAEFTYMQNIATRVVLNTRRFMDLAIYEAIVGDKDAGFYRLNEEDIRRFYYFKPMGSSITHVKELRQQQIQMAIDTTAKIPPQMMQMNVQPFTVNYYELLKTAFDAVDIKNTDRILIPVQAPQAPAPGMGVPGVPGGGIPNPNEMQALANVMYGQGGGGGALQEILASAGQPQGQGGGM